MSISSSGDKQRQIRRIRIGQFFEERCRTNIPDDRNTEIKWYQINENGVEVR